MWWGNLLLGLLTFTAFFLIKIPQVKADIQNCIILLNVIICLSMVVLCTSKLSSVLFFSSGLIQAAARSSDSWPYKGLKKTRMYSRANLTVPQYTHMKKKISILLIWNCFSSDVTAGCTSPEVLTEVFKHVDQSWHPNRSAVAGWPQALVCG